MRGLAIFVASGGEGLDRWQSQRIRGDLEATCLPAVERSAGPNACMFELLGLNTTPGLTRKGENLPEEGLRYLEDGWILVKNVVACLRVRDHELYVLFQVNKWIIRLVFKSLHQPDIPQKTIDACYGSICPV